MLCMGLDISVTMALVVRVELPAIYKHSHDIEVDYIYNSGPCHIKVKWYIEKGREIKIENER